MLFFLSVSLQESPVFIRNIEGILGVFIKNRGGCFHG